MKNTLIIITSLFVFAGFVSAPSAYAVEYAEITTNAPLSGSGTNPALVGDFFAALNAYDLANNTHVESNTAQPTSNETTSTTTDTSPLAMNTYIPVREQTVRNTTTRSTVVVYEDRDEREAYATDGYNAEITKLNYGTNHFAVNQYPNQYQASVIQSQGGASLVNSGGLLLVFALLFGVLWYVRRRYRQRKAMAYQYAAVPAYNPYYLEEGYAPMYR